MKNNYKHGQSHCERPGPTYVSWLAMKKRCFNPNSINYKYYGGLGVTVCDRWKNSFLSFLTDMGERPVGTTLDRYPNKNGNYEPGNVRWSTPKEQANNRSYKHQP